MLLASSHRFSYTEAAEASAVEVVEASTGKAPAGKVTSGNEVGQMYIYTPFSLRQVDSNKQCFYNIHVYLSAAHNTVRHICIVART